ncbi:hypothetical protein GCK72_013976 [Caenorhabditis remanei]|uniref:C-type lectin domain-containing protein n=1 Tax=Caenorhabditis remanei TaxID=31234 RepID=A0A6A5GQ49_CAERE|nr:hypothetical protein GCK72_013976 [Caenorhabditis remanei]KAF1757520.1 hypothetical protein GCK72_013976 [Caenorhabditis remanei]
MRPSILVGFFLLTLSGIGAVSVAKSTDNDIVLKVSTDKQTSRDGHHFTGEWLESPWGDLYQFRAGDQNWLVAREHCLSLNADLAAIRNVEQLDWILSHYAPLSSRFGQRLVQIGLYAPEGQTHEWKWLNGNEINKTLQWSSGEPYDHSMEGRERCGLLNVEKRVLDDVDCESTSPDHHAQRYICQRTSESHKQQQRSNNYIWQKIENLFSFFGIGGSPTPHNATVTNTNDYEDEVVKNETSTAKSAVKFSDSEETSSEEEESVAKTLAALPKIEGSGESTSLKELQEPEGSGQIVDKKAIEAADLIPGVDEKKLDKMIDKMEEMIKSIDDLTVPPAGLERTTVSTIVVKKEEKFEEKKKTDDKKEEEHKKDKELNDNKISESIEGDFDHEQSKDMPKADIEPPKEEDCDEEEGSGSGEEEAAEEEESGEKLELAPEKEDKIKEFLGVLRLFLDRAEHGDLRKLLDDQSGKTLLERMKNAVREANKREFEMLEKLEISKKKGEQDELVTKKDQMSTEEQKDLYKKISSAVMKAAKLHKIEEKVQDEQAMEKFNIAKVKADSEEESEGTLEVLKSAREGKAEKKEKVGDDDYYGDYLDDNNVIKVQNREKKDAKKGSKEKNASEDKKESGEKKELKKKNEQSHYEPKKEEVEEKKEKMAEEKVDSEEKKKEEESVKEEKPTEELKKNQEVNAEEKNVLKQKEEEEKATEETTTTTTEEKEEETTISVEQSASVSSIKPAEAEEDEAELEASGQEDIVTTTESTTVAIKEVPSEEIEKIAKLEAKQLVEDEKVTEETKEEATTTIPSSSTESEKTSPSTTTSEATTPTSTTPVTTTKPVTVAIKTVSPEEMEKLSKIEATEKVTLLPPLPTFTFPTLAPFTFPTLPTLATAKPTPAPKVPTLEEILGNLNDQFKKLLSPPKPLPPK